MSKVETTNQPKDRRRTARNAFVQLQRRLHCARAHGADDDDRAERLTWSRLGDIPRRRRLRLEAATSRWWRTMIGGSAPRDCTLAQPGWRAAASVSAATSVYTNPGGSSWSIGPEGVSPSKRGGQAWPRGPLELLGPDIYRFRIGLAKVYFTSSNYHQSLVFLLQL